MNAQFSNGVSVHSIWFGDYNTWNTWKLFPTTRPLVAPPKPNTKLETVKGYDGYLDYTKVLSNTITFKDREGSWEFRVIETSKNSWKDVYNDIVDKIDGKYFDKIILDDELQYKYQGRLNVSSWKNNGQETTITIAYRLYPYKIQATSTSKDWVWDTLSFEPSADFIYYDTFRLYGNVWKSFVNPSDHNVPLSLNCSAPVQMTTVSRPFNLMRGENRNVVQLQPGVNTFLFKGTADVTVQYNMEKELL